MGWRCGQSDYRHRSLARIDEAEAERYDDSVGRLSREDEEAYLSDLRRVAEFRPGMVVLDAGAGTGALTSILVRLPGVSLTALEPAPAMLARLARRPELRGVITVQGFCDALEDRCHFPAARFDAIATRQLANGLFDPLTAFRNWHHWLKPRGAVVVIDGLYGRSAWTGAWEEDVEALPLAAVQGLALIPYLLEAAGFRVEAVQFMESVNARPATKTPRYVVVAAKES